MLLAADLEAVVLTNGRELYEPASKHDLAPDTVSADVLAAAAAALRRHDGDELDAILRRRRLIAQFWGVDEVQAVCPELDDERAWEVLLDIESGGDSETPVTDELIAETATALFPADGD